MDVRDSTLDQDDWDEMKNLDHFMIDDLMTLLESIRDQTNRGETVSAVRKKIAGDYHVSKKGQN